jgi:hypothetical protein
MGDLILRVLEDRLPGASSLYTFPDSTVHSLLPRARLR